MNKFNIYVTRVIPQAGLEYLRKECGSFDMNPHPKTLTKSELMKKVKGRDGILCLLTDIIDSEVMESAGQRIRILSNCAVGYDNIEMPAATGKGILVTNTPGVLTETTAESAWSLLLSAARKIAESDRYVRAGKFKGWEPTLLLGQNVSGKTLGIIGAGRIGTAFARMSKGFHMRVLYNDPSVNKTLEKELDAKKVSLKTLLEESDFVSVHVNLKTENLHLIGKKELETMKPTAILINTSRGPVINEKELVKALRKGKIFAAGLDVYEREPRLSPGLAQCTNTILLPHLASATTETRNRMALLAAENLVLGLKGMRPRHMVNPEVLNA